MSIKQKSTLTECKTLVQVTNSLTNCGIGMAPKDLTQDHVGYLVYLTLNENLRKSLSKIGDTVRFRRNLELFYKGYRVQFSHEIFHISAILTKNAPTYWVVPNETSELILRRFYEPEFIKYQEIGGLSRIFRPLECGRGPR